MSVEWVPLLSGTLHPRAGGLPSIPLGVTSAQSPGWPLLGLAAGERLRVVATLTTTPPRRGRHVPFVQANVVAG